MPSPISGGRLAAPKPVREVAEQAIAAPRMSHPRAAREVRASTTILGGEDDAGMRFGMCGAIGSKLGASTLEWFGSCVLISGRVALTAGHVGDGQTKNRAGFNSAATVLTGTGALELAGSMRRHPGNLASLSTFDLAAFILEDAAPASIVPAAIASDSEFLQAQEVILAGWGTNVTGASEATGANVRRFVKVPIQHLVRKESDDLSAPAGRLKFDPRVEFVVGDEASHRGACFGDSGGPAFVEVGGTPKLVGVVKGNVRGEANCLGLTVVTRLDKLRDFWEPILANQSVT